MATNIIAKFLLCLALVLPTAAMAQDRPAFPGAMGFGAQATGWRGGTIRQVTNLADSGPGSLRQCAESGPAPRVCVFEVSGTIAVNSPIRVRPNVYIAGQTAPGDGIQLRLGQAWASPLVLKRTNDVVIRFLKTRPGQGIKPTPSVDGITIETGQRIYLDHLSIMFATDENINLHVNNGVISDVTIANSIIALGLDRANHPKGRHSKGALICSGEGVRQDCGRISLMRNLFAHNRDRNPDIKATSIGPVEVINNVFYNAISQFGEFYNTLGDTRINYVGNVILSGPSTIRKRPEAVQAFYWQKANVFEIYAADNIALARRKCKKDKPFAILDDIAKTVRRSGAIEPISVEILPAASVLDYVLATAGDRLPQGRVADRLDQRVIDDVRTCAGRVIDAIQEVGGWPEISPATAALDSDRDGLPDYWEARNPALDPARADDVWARDAGTGWSYIETYLSTLAGDPLGGVAARTSPQE